MSAGFRRELFYLVAHPPQRGGADLCDENAGFVVNGRANVLIRRSNRVRFSCRTNAPRRVILSEANLLTALIDRARNTMRFVRTK